MNPRYQDFLDKNPTLQDRIEAFTSGILSPDTKAITLWSMEPERFYTKQELHTRVKEFSGGNFPISSSAVWQYCDGIPKRFGGSLYRIGTVVKVELDIEDLVTGPKVGVRYAKTTGGQDFGDALVARAVILSGMLNPNEPMLSIFSQAHKPKDAKTRRGYVVYKVIKTLAEKQGRVFREVDLEELTGFSRALLCRVLNDLGEVRIIDYKSPCKENKGKKAAKWAEYRLVNKTLLEKTAEELYEETRPFNRCSGGYMKTVLDYIKDKPEAIYEYNDLSEKLKIPPREVSAILSLFKRVEYLDAEFGGNRIQSMAKANKNTIFTFKTLVEPIEAIAETLDPQAFPHFDEPLNDYNLNINKRANDIQRLLRLYNRKRNSRWLEGSEEINGALLNLPKGDYKLSEVIEIVNRRIERRLSPVTIAAHLKSLIKLEKFEKIERGFYRKI